MIKKHKIFKIDKNIEWKSLNNILIFSWLKSPVFSDQLYYYFFFSPPRGFDPQSLGADSRRISPQDHGAPLKTLLLNFQIGCSLKK